MNVYLLWHTHELPGGQEDCKLVGVYSSRESAEAALKRVLQLPGFRDAPNGFNLDRQQMDRDGWVRGYVMSEGRAVRKAEK